MLGKNNNNERVKKMAMQDKQDHFSIRKLSIGAASVLLGFTFFGLNSKTVKADTVIPTQQTEENTKTQENISPQDTTTPPGSISDAQNSTTAVKAEKTNKPEDGPNLATFSGLSSFLRATNSDNKQGDSAKSDKTENSTDKADKNDQQDPATNTEQNSNHSQQDQPTDQKPGDTTDSPNTADITNEDQTDADQDIDTTPINTMAQEDSSPTRSVSTWEDFVTAYQNINVSEIDITADIRSNKGNGRDPLNFPGRKLLIKSAGDAKYTIDFRSIHPKIKNNTIGDITYENLTLMSADYFGVVNTHGGKSARVTFRNIDFKGSQLLYTDSNTDIIFEGTINAETVEMPMETGGVNDGSKQQLLEFTKDNNSITFKAGCKFTGATFGGTLIEMKGKNNVLNVEDGADVTLIPLKTYNGKNGANNGQYTRPINAIYIEGDSQVNVNGTVNIRIGESSGLKYDGVQNAGQARAIYLESKTSKVNIGRGGTINVNTNGNISTKNGQHLIYVGGDFTIHSGGALKITGENMGNYSGTLVQIDGKANVQNGGFEIQLVGDAGTGAIKLVDVAKTGQLIVNNPTSLVLDAHLNTNDATSVIGDNKITVTNVRQLLNLNDILGQTNGSQNNLVLPPFHVLQVEKANKTIAVNKLELLNGMRQFDLEQVKKDNPKLGEILNKLQKISKLLADNNHKTYDELFDAVIEAAFSNKDNPGYNNIRFIPANPSGFLDIDPANVTVTDQEDGSKIIKGQVLNYVPSNDGPASDGFFQSVLPGGTEAYVLASFKDSGVYKNGQAIIDSAIPNPYADTIDTYRGEANDLALLPTKFAAQVAADGTFTITLPPEITTKMAKDATIQLTPHANFIDYSPLDIADGIRPTIVSLGIKPFSEIQQEAAQAIKDAISTAKANKPKSLTEDQEKAFTDAMNEAAKYAANIRDDNYESDKSVYGVQSSKTAISEVNTRKKTALDIVAKAVQAAKGQADFEKAKSDAITKLTQQANDQVSKFPSQAQTIINAKDQAISNVQAPETNNTNIEQVVNDGITAINQAGKDYRDNVKTDINQSITKAEKAIDEVAKDENVKSPVDELITGLKDRLKRPKEIVATDGDLDQDDNEKAIDNHQKEAKDAIQGVQDTVDAIKALEEAAKKQIAQHADDKEDIQGALNQAIKDIINSSNPKDDVNKGLDNINGTHANKEREKAANDISEAAAKAIERIKNSGLSENEQQPYLDEVKQVVADATATTGDTGKSIYGTDDDEIINKRKSAAESLINKAAAKSEIVGYTKGYENILGKVEKAETAMKDALTAIDRIEDNADSSQNITQTVKTAKDNILNAFKEGAKAQVKADADTAKGNLGVAKETNIDSAVTNAGKTIDSHSSATDIKQDIIDGKKNVLDAYKSAAKNQLEAAKKAVVDKIQKNPNLTAKNKDEAVNKANDLLTGDQGYNGRIDKGEILADVDESTKEGTAALNDLLNEQNLKGQRNQAITDIQNAKDKAISTITNDNNLSAEDKTKYQDLINAAADTGIANVTQDDNETAIETDKNNAISNITDYLENAANAGTNNLDQQRQAAITEIENAAKAAKNKIDSFDDTDLSPEAKQHYKEAIDKDFNNAKALINAAKDIDGVNSAKQAAKDSINKDLAAAQLIVAKSQANKALQAEREKDLGIINQAFEDNKIDGDQKDALTNKINGFYETAVGKVYNDFTTEQVVKDRDDGIDAMASVAGSIADEQAKFLEQQKDDALTNEDTGLNALAEKIRADIEKDPNLSGKEKNGYYDEIDNALTTAKTNIQNADTKEEIDSAANAGREALNKIRDKAALQSNRNAALKELLGVYNEVNDKISGLQNVNSTTKEGLIKQLTNYYDDAVAKVKNAAIDQVDTEKQEGIDNMRKVIRDAQSLDTNINIAKEDIDNHAKQAIDEINQSSMSDADKTETISKINNERDKAKQNIESQKTNEAVDKAKKDGRDAIDQVVADATTADLEDAKNNSEDTINSAAQEAINRLNSSYNSLSAEEKADAKSQYDKAITDINQAANSAISKLQNVKTKEDVNKITTDAITAINKAEASGNLAITKAQARKAIKDVASEVKSSLKDKADQESVDSIVGTANTAINAAQDSGTVLGIRDTTIKQIRAIKATAESNDADKIKKAKEEAINALTDELNGKHKADGSLDPDAPGILNQIDQIKGLSKEEKDKYQSQATNAWKEAVNQVNGQQKVTDIESATITGIINIDKALSDAQLQAAKNNANKYLDDIAKTAADEINKIDQSALSDEEKAKQIDLINSNKDTASKNINKAQTPADVEQAKQAGEDAIKGIVQNAKDNATLLQEQNAAYNALVEQAKKLNQRLNDDLLHNKLDQNQVDELSNAISAALGSAKTNISAATDQDKINAARSKGESALNNISSDIDKEEALTKALNDLQTAATNAKAKADEAEDSDAANQMKTQIDQEQKKAAAKINAARNNKQNTITQIQTAANDGIATINKLGEDFENKNQIVKGLKEYAASAKNEIAGLGLAGSDVANGYKDIDQALNDGISSIYGGTSDKLSQLEQDAKANIDQAKLPSQLTAEKNKLINQFKDYVNSKGKIKDVATNLEQDQIDSLQKQLDEAIKRTIDKIASVKLENSYEDALAQAQHAEKGSATEDFGEAEVDRIFQVAQESVEIVTAKQDAISQVEKAQKEANDAIDKSGLSPEDQQKQKEQVQKLVEKARTDINSISQSEENAEEKINSSKEQAIADIQGVKDQAALAGQKTKAESILKDKQTKAHSVIDQSQLTAEQKKAAKAAIDDAYQQSFQDIESAQTIDDLPDEANIGQNIDRLLTKPETGTEPEWFDLEQNNALKGAEGVDGLNKAFDKLKDRLKDKLSQKLSNRIDDKINTIIAATDIQTASAAYDEAMTIINKENAKADIDEKADEVTNEIDGNDKLSTESKDKLKEQIKEDSQKAKDKIDAINAPKGDTSGKKDQIDKIKEIAKEDINSAGNAAKDESNNMLKEEANAELADKHQNAVNELKDKFGENADTTSVDKAYHEHSRVNGDSPENIAADKIAAEKEIAKGSVTDTANNAKNQVDKLKHQDGSDYTDIEKQVIKDHIDQEIAKANTDKIGTIDQAQDSEAVETARKDAVDRISSIIVADSKELDDVLNNNSKVQEERLKAAYDSAVKALTDRFNDKANTTSVDQAYENAKDALNDPANADKLAATELAGEKAIAAGALAEAQKAATSEIQSTGKYTEQEKKAIINQINTDLNTANNALNQPEVNDSQTITKLRDDAINQIYLDATDSTTIDHILHDNSQHENNHSSTTQSVPAPVDNKPVDNTGKEEKEEPELDLSHSEELALMHNAYLYDKNGERANKVVLGAGSVITSYGIKEINGKHYYILVDRGNKNQVYYVAIGNVVPTSRKLKHNAYVYNKHGKRIKKAGVLRKGNNINTYGSAVNIRGKKYFIIAQNRYVKAANIAIQKTVVTAITASPVNEPVTEKQQPVVEKTIMHNSYLYNQNGKRANKVIILAGSIVNTVNFQMINNKGYYMLDDGLFIAAANIDAKKLKLKHNAYVYSQHGIRISKKVLHKHKVVKTYGSAVRINNKKYYIVAKNKYIKAN